MQYYTLFYMLFYIKICSASKGHHGWCGVKEAFCLFSQNRVSDLSEAQLKCSETKDDSWPVELGDERVKEVFIEFIHNYSISNVILNAFNRNGNWYWKKNNISIRHLSNMISKKDMLLYNSSEHSSDYSVVCMTSCHAKWTEISKHGMDDSSAINNPNIRTPETCKEQCEKDVTCSSIDWTYGNEFHGCWIHKYPYEDSRLRPKIGTSHHVINRSSKSLDKCIHESFNFSGSLTSSLQLIIATFFLHLHCLLVPFS